MMHPGLGLLLGILFAVSASASETRFEIDPRVDLERLTRTGEIMVHVERQGRLYTSDASSVLRVDLDRLEAVSADYDRYVAFGMPGLKTSRVIRRQGDERLIWTHLESWGFSTRHYLQALIHQRFPDQARGMQWSLYRPSPADHDLRDPDRPAFHRLDGSWFMQPLGDGRVYVRYFLLGDPSLPLPDFLLEAVIIKQFRDGVRDVIRALARTATVRQ